MPQTIFCCELALYNHSFGIVMVWMGWSGCGWFGCGLVRFWIDGKVGCEGQPLIEIHLCKYSRGLVGWKSLSRCYLDDTWAS